MLSAPAPDRPDSHLRNCRRSLRYAALVWVDRHVCTKSSTASEKRTRHLWARPMESVGIASIVRSAPLCQSNESSPSSPGQTHAPCPGRRGVRIRGLTWMVPAAGASVARQAARPVSPRGGLGPMAEPTIAGGASGVTMARAGPHPRRARHFAFLAGAALGGRLRVAMAGVSRRRWLLTFALAEAGLLFAVALVSIGFDIESAAPSSRLHAVIVLTAVAMGLRNATARRLAVSDLTTTVLTLTLTDLA